MKKIIEDHGDIKAWQKRIKACGGCIQCQHPWYDGLCDCKLGKSDETWKGSAEIGFLIQVLLRNGWKFKSDYKYRKEKPEKVKYLPKAKLQRIWE